MRVLIVGCGYVGIELGGQLVEAGHDVFGVRRRPEQLPRGIRPIAADVTDPRSLRALPTDVDHVCYAVAADRSDAAAYERAYVIGLRNVLDVFRETNAPRPRIVFVSSTAVYGQRDGEWVDETSATEPLDFRGAHMLDAEDLFHSGPFESVCARASGIYGPGRTRAIDRVRRGQGAAGAIAPVYGNRIHRADLAAALIHLMRLPRPDPVYIVSDDEPAPLVDVYQWLADRLGVTLEPANGAAPVTRHRSTNKRCSNARLKGSGFELCYPSFREGYGQLLRAGA